MLIDTHCHLDSEDFRSDLQEVLDRAAAAKIEHMLTIGIDRTTSENAVRLAEQYPQISAVVGIQPNYVSSVGPDDWERIINLTDRAEVVGIGETGLDRYWDYAPMDAQEEWFRRHLQLSRSTGKPFIVHCREAEDDVCRVFDEEAQGQPFHGLMHSFCGSRKTLERCLEHGLYISFAGMVTFRKNTELREAAAAVPEDRLLVETDAPYLAPMPNRGKRNEPAWVSHTAACIAEARQTSADSLAEITTRNARRLFASDRLGGGAPPGA